MSLLTALGHEAQRHQFWFKLNILDIEKISVMAKN
jgi:hypothetical protein